MSKKKMPEHVAQAVIERADGACEVMNFPICTGRAGPIHHRKISGREHTIENCVHICDACHRWIHAHPADSYELGWLVRMSYDPAEVVFAYRGRPSLLGADGSVEAQ